MIQTYSPDRIVLILFGCRMSGFGEGSMIKIAMGSEAVTKHVGADGKVTRVISLDKSGTVTLTLAQASLSNDVLATAYRNRRNALGVRPFSLTDLAGTTQAHAPNAWVEKIPEAEFGKEQSNREWVIGLDDLDLYVGGISLA